MSDDKDRTPAGLVPTLRGGLATRSSSLVRRGLNLLNASQGSETPAALNREDAPDDEFGFDALWTRAEEGDADAQLQVAFFCTVSGTQEKAVSWLRKAAEQGHREAQCALGNELRGSSPEEAVSWLLKSAERGHAEAQYLLGWRYIRGEGVLKDRVEGCKWLCLASARASGDAQKGYAANRDAQIRLMTTGEVAEAQRRAAEWQEAFLKPG